MFILIPTTTSPHQTHSYCLIHSNYTDIEEESVF